jgi:hypothetical protein
MADKKQVRLRIFAHHVGTLALAEVGDKGKLYTVDGSDLYIDYEIKQGASRHGHVFNEVWLNGRCCGNRWGGIQVLAKLIQAENPTIHPDGD